MDRKLCRKTSCGMLVLATAGGLAFLVAQMPVFSSPAFAASNQPKMTFSTDGKKPEHPQPAVPLYDINHVSADVDGVNVAGLHKVEDLTAMHQQPTTASGTKLVKIDRPGTFKMTRAWTNALEWHNWRQSIADGKLDKRTVNLVFRNAAGAELGRLSLYGCMPAKHVPPVFNAKNSAHPVEEIYIAYATAEFK